jgi:hypothetical protein
VFVAGRLTYLKLFIELSREQLTISATANSSLSSLSGSVQSIVGKAGN